MIGSHTAMTTRTLRCANGPLYMGFVLGIIAAAVYVSLTRLTGLWEILGVAGLTLIAALWGGFYYFLRFRIDEEGVTRSLLCRHQRIRWADITTAEMRHNQSPGTEACTIILNTAQGSITLSSDLLPLEQVEELAKELKQAGILN